MVKAVPALLYVCTDGPNLIDIHGHRVFEVMTKISVDNGETNQNKSVIISDYDAAVKFIEMVNYAPEPLHVNFFNDPEFPDELYQEVEIDEEGEESVDDTFDHS